MSDFTSVFWSAYVAVLTLLSIVACGWLLVVMSRARVQKDPKSRTTETTGHTWDGDLAEYNNPLPRWWMQLFWITIVFGVGYLILFPGFGSMPGVLGWSSSGAYSEERREIDARMQPLLERYLAADVPTVAANPEARAMGERLFLNYCSQCHGSAAAGAKGYPNLTDRDWLYGGDPEAIKTTISGGRLGVMPPFGAALGDRGVKDTVAYVRSLSGLSHDGLRAQIGRPLFMQNCAACHGADGKGNQAVGAPNLTDPIWLYGSSENEIAQGITNGRHMDVAPGMLAMPSFKDTLGEGRIHLLVAYVWGLSNLPAAR